MWGTYIKTTEVDSNLAKLWIETKIQNNYGENKELKYKVEVLSADGDTISSFSDDCKVENISSKTVISGLAVDKPKLWSTDKPYLYSLKSSLIQK